ncbi:hypothetical protein COS31_05525 [Candidatus Roizmanbacteria bacterium CG02_land_8_20_14_3_00_36_15]|uniref:DNA polymerase III delta N-terminal domain-containing protein n=2 Tax=Candidatus Roizmaniibacteriota TaxID=1752723 RepID=A0A2M8KME5_9BACT|nr:MAG: hypothetical protein COS51_01205 [Candidatus Roizmanbacteria bacterium CG03_land_8_20_14_0_80_36_21]PIV37270.1 MAG: hypothetical protein COS31_05525 [Candidatus Roizmanbacteria bacterium CG02_land_8_20_14_3_00_36_15]PIY70325.1 MAG: hypothetical protein COY89_01750 [Candidatus Roizmanbacteria bacterium CG_4_10_14_0_8_um_filter_36_36]PJA53108.1 MAG: hypothetical protein CO166_03040 [Candidatus Roizmanbacteria bacterium CG_4_9_14_3_um_filter_36_11]PJC81293.1 MAG: hypothetical protein CO007
MLPLIIVSKDQKNISRFIKKFIEENSFSAPFVFEIRPVKEEISINQIRELKHDLIISEKNKRLIIFYNFDKSGLDTQNALLKILEELVEKNQFLLMAANAEKIIPTIHSRSKLIKIDKAEFQPTLDKDWQKLVQTIVLAKNLDFLTEAKVNVTTKEQALICLNRFLVFFKNELNNNVDRLPIIVKIIKKIFLLMNLLENNNLNPQLTVDELLIFIWKRYNVSVRS